MRLPVFRPIPRVFRTCIALQVSCYFQAQTQQTTLSNNICFNGPRAGFNFNDGMVSAPYNMQRTTCSVRHAACIRAAATCSSAT